MTALKSLLNDIADQAKQYDGTERAITAARRRRRLTRLAPVAIAVALVAGVAAVWLPLRPMDEPGQEPASTLPAELVIPAQDPPSLPADRGVGRAVLGYLASRPEDPRGTYLLTADGQQYEVIPPMHERGQLVGISPDGRWLLRVVNDEMVLRDLTGTTEMRLPIPRTALHAYWSPDGRLLAVQQHGEWVGSGYAGEPKPEVTLIDLGTLQARTLSLAGHPDTQVFAMLDSGELALKSTRPARLDPPVVEVWWIDAQTGAQRRHFTLDMTPWLTDRELSTTQIFNSGQMCLHPDGHTLLVRPGTPLSTGGSTADDVLAIDLDSSQVTRRYAVPDPSATMEGHPPVQMTRDSRAGIAVAPEGLLLRHNLGWELYPASELELLDLTTGARRVLTRLPAEIRLLEVRGG